MTFDQLDFATYCIGSISERTGLSQPDVYDKLKKSGILYEYIVPYYKVLSSYSEKYILPTTL